jgi:hypothetical protein
VVIKAAVPQPVNPRCDLREVAGGGAARACNYQTSPGRQSQLIGKARSSGGEDGVGSTMM